MSEQSKKPEDGVQTRPEGELADEDLKKVSGGVLSPVDLPARIRIEPAQVPTLGSHPGGHILTNA